MVFLLSKEPKYFQRGPGNLLANEFHEKFFPFTTSPKSLWMNAASLGEQPLY